jgi:hypothetical protein
MMPDANDDARPEANALQRQTPKFRECKDFVMVVKVVTVRGS